MLIIFFYIGIISAIAFCPAHTGLLATGSYGQTTAICREDNMELLYVLHGQQGGVTHVSNRMLNIFSLKTHILGIKQTDRRYIFFSFRSCSPKMEITYIQVAGRTLISSAGIFGRLQRLFTNFTDQLKTPTSEYCLISNHAGGISGLGVRYFICLGPQSLV